MIPDIKKVTKGLETCYCPPSNCEDCPYNDLPDEQSCNDMLCLDTLALLKLKEKKTKALPIMGTTICECYNCKHLLAEGMNYCPVCGYEIDWSEYPTEEKTEGIK